MGIVKHEITVRNLNGHFIQVFFINCLFIIFPMNIGLILYELGLNVYVFVLESEYTYLYIFTKRLYHNLNYSCYIFGHLATRHSVMMLTVDNYGFRTVIMLDHCTVVLNKDWLVFLSNALLFYFIYRAWQGMRNTGF